MAVLANHEAGTRAPRPTRQGAAREKGGEGMMACETVVGEHISALCCWVEWK